MLSSIEANSENIIYGPQIASAYIFNNNYNTAISWIELYENAKQVDSNSIYTRVSIRFIFFNDTNSFINSINLTLNNYIDLENNQNAELLFVLKDIMNLEINSNINLNLDKIFDDRVMPSIFLFNEINNSIINNNNEKFLIYSLISLNGKEWDTLHPKTSQTNTQWVFNI